jgi:4'-phosphopantetheinyl transferase
MPLLRARFINSINWLPVRSGFLAAPCVDVYRLFLSGNKHMLAFAASILSDKELERARNYRSSYDTERFMLSKAALRCLLAQYSGTPPQAIQLSKDAQGKPFAEGVNIRFNIAHAGDIALLAFSDDDLGVDVECINNSTDYKLVMDTCFNCAEQDYVNSSGIPPNQFYKLWTRKEAIVKATGKGIVDEIVDIPVLDGDGQVNSHAIGSERDWVVDSFYPAEDYMGSLAYPGDRAGVRFFDYALAAGFRLAK